eukprot:CAMPEP_0177667208 /NCGR_PEP_ID=MMETSP0447-20121125/21996_1 /TAXON_ID=0 /ORGANISM="Stygamoeba regulata, Strain BSH-02190019" /LENGTH=125 /DNA_ID=CAMNT_0019173415 /DNA_START=43 /DNA_END=420 /DNA_ORIENTATION=+
MADQVFSSAAPYVLTGVLDTVFLCAQAAGLLLPPYVVIAAGAGLAKGGPPSSTESMATRLVTAGYLTFVAGFVGGFGYLSVAALSDGHFLSSLSYSGLPLIAIPAILCCAKLTIPAILYGAKRFW